MNHVVVWGAGQAFPWATGKNHDSVSHDDLFVYIDESW
jgi:hypothetical protein